MEAFSRLRHMTSSFNIKDLEEKGLNVMNCHDCNTPRITGCQPLEYPSTPMAKYLKSSNQGPA